MQKGKMDFPGKYPKTRDIKWAHVFHHNCELFQKNSPLHNLKSKLCNGLLKNKTLTNLVKIIVFPFCDALK